MACRQVVVKEAAHAADGVGGCGGERGGGMTAGVSRRGFVAAASAAVAAVPFAGCLQASPRSRLPACARGSFALDDNRVRFFCPALRDPVRVVVIGDTHLFLDDARGEPFKAYSGRMAKAYNRTRHVKTGAETNPQACFESALAMAKESRADLIALAGDIFSFPSEAAIDWALEKLAGAGVPYLYVAGNHDWHYEGMEGAEVALRAEWTERRLKPLYQGRPALAQAVEVKGLRFLAIDDSTYEILPEQRAFFREQAASGRPLALLMHVPLYAPGRDVGFGCGHPDWNAASDRNWQIERRPRWPESGHTAVTRAFWRDAVSAPNLLGVFAGHTHRQSLDVVDGVPQLVTAANAAGGFLVAEFGGSA